MLLTIEGVDGVGKTTLMNGLIRKFKTNEKILKENNDIVPYKTIFTKEPHFIDAEMKQLIVHETDPLTKFNWFYNDHLKHLEKVILPNVNDSIIICDRYIHSRIAYQGYEIEKYYSYDATRTDMLLKNLELIHDSSRWPDKVYMIWMDEDLLVKRLTKGHDGMDETFIHKLKAIEENYRKVLRSNRVPYYGITMDEHDDGYIEEEIFDDIYFMSNC